MKKIIKNKRGLLTKTTIGAIILIASFVVVLLFIRWSNLKNTINKETCHQSIIMRSTFNLGALQAGTKTIPLRCRTEKICVTMSGEGCEESGMVSTDESPVTKIKISSNLFEAKEEIKEIMADALYDCHSMLGEGKLNFMPRKVWNKRYCLICSRIDFDKKAREEIESISLLEFDLYLQEKKDSEGKSYSKYLFPAWDLEKDKQVFDEILKRINDPLLNDLKFEDLKIIDLTKKEDYAVIAQIVPEGFAGQIGAGLAAIGAVGLIATGIGAPAGIGLLVVEAGAGGLAFWKTTPEQEFFYAPPEIFPYDADSLKKLECSSFETAP